MSVTEAEAVLKHTNPDKSPGIEHILVDLCKACRTDLAPALAGAFMVIGNAGRVPKVHRNRKGTPCSPRKILTDQLAWALDQVVTLEQSVILPNWLL